MLFSGYQLGVHLLNSTFEKISLDREEVIKKSDSIKIIEKHLHKYTYSRNSIFIVEGPFKDSSNRKFLVKQPRFVDGNYISSILNENYILGIFRDAKFTKLDNLSGFDKFQYLLFVKFIDGDSISKLAEPEKDFLDNTLKSLASFFSDVHHINSDLIKSSKYPDKFGYRKPIFFSYSKRDFQEFILEKSSTDREYVVNILTENNYELFDLIKSFSWNQDILIHFDFKFEHLILETDGKVKTIVDWEMADMGDIHWDIASIWFEILQSHIIGYENDLDGLMSLSIEYLNVFIENYSKEIDFLKLQNFLGVFILHKHFYGLFAMGGISEQIVNLWILKAKELIIGKELIGNFTNISNKNLPLKVEYTPETNDANHVHDIRKNGLGTFNQIEEISTLIFEKYKTDSSPDRPKLSEFIYSWFNGNLGKKRELDKKNEIAEQPKIGNEIMLEDFWWQVEGYSKNNSVVIRKGSERRMAEPGVFIYMSHNPQQSPNSLNRSFVKLQYPSYIVRPNDAKPDSNDLWILSKQQIRQDYGNWIRFYFHLNDKVEGINLFIDNITEKLNERSIPFQLKLRNALSSYTRTDVAIVFVHRQHFNASLDSIIYVHDLLKDEYLEKEIPKFTKSFKNCDGLSFAENPTEATESFGNWRAKLIAKIIQNQCPDMDSISEISGVIQTGLKAEGFNLYELYRNPYPEKNEFKYRFDLVNDKLKSPPKLDSGIISSLKYLPSQRFLKAARSVAFILCREAIWYGDYCTWISFKKDEEDEGYFSTVDTSEILGIGLFIGHIANLCPSDLIFGDCLLGIVNIFKGRKSKISNEGCLKFIIKKLNETKLEPVFAGNQTNNVSIEIQDLYRNEFSNSESKSKFLADVLIDKYVDKKIPLPNGHSENWDDLNGTEFNPTITHGIAGLGYFFLTLINNRDHPIVPLKTFFTDLSESYYPYFEKS